MLKPMTACTKNEDFENKFNIEKWKKNSSSIGSMIIKQEAVKIEDTVKYLNKDDLNRPKAKIIKIEDTTKNIDISSQTILKNIKRPYDIEINIGGKKSKISRPSLPADIKSTSTSAITKIPSRKSDSNLSINKTTNKAPNLTYSIETLESPESNTIIKDKSVNQKPKSILKKKSTSCTESPKCLGNGKKISPKKQTGLPLNLEKMFKKKPNVPLIMANKTKDVDKTRIPNLKQTNSVQKKPSITFALEPSTSSNACNSKVVDKLYSINQAEKIDIKQEHSEPHEEDPLKISTKVVDIKFDINKKSNTSVPAIPSFSIAVDSTSYEDTTNRKSGSKNILSRGINRFDNNIVGKQDSTKEKIKNAFTDLIESYRYLITPKSWYVTEMSTDTRDQLIVFYNCNVMKENNVYVSVMKKSLILDKDANLHYSVHGLPVDLRTTILPKVLDSTKKLLSILHIFDKMQICEGIGDDLDIIQDEAIFKDTCRFWRHRDCKIILMKTTRCHICSETREVLLESEN